MGSGVSKGNKQSNGKQDTVILVKFSYMENENRSGIKKVNQSNMDIKDTTCKSENILNPSSAPEASSESNENAEKNKLPGNPDDTNQSGTSHSDIHIAQHVSGYSYTQDDTQKKLSENNENINAKHEEQKKSTHSPTKEDNNSSTTDDMSGHYHKQDSCQSGNTVADVCRTTDDASDITEANLLEGIDETLNQINDSLRKKSSEPSTSTQASQQTKGSNSEHESIKSQNEFSDKTADMGNVNKSFDEKDNDVDIPTDSSEERKSSTEVDIDKSTAKDNKNENVELSEYRLNENVLFYRNELCSKPFPGARIEDMLTWKGDYQKLERTHSYIQWLFPIPDSRGMNYSAQPLQEHEAQIISVELRNKVLEAFKMMLDFYGMELDLETESVKRAGNWKERFEHLNRSTHNHFRITRIIKSLGELGWKNLQVPWIQFMMNEAIINKELPKLTDKTLSHFIDAIKEEEDKWNQYGYLSDLNSHARKQEEVRKTTKQLESVISSDGTPATKDETNSDKVSENENNLETGIVSDKIDKTDEAEGTQETLNDNCETTGDEITKKQGTVIETKVESKETEISKNDDSNSKNNGDNVTEINKKERNMNKKESDIKEIGNKNSSENANDRHDSSSNICHKINETDVREDESDREKHKPNTKDAAKTNIGFIETLEVNANCKVDMNENKNNGNENMTNRSEDRPANAEAPVKEIIDFSKDNHNTAQKEEPKKIFVSKVNETGQDDDGIKNEHEQGIKQYDDKVCKKKPGVQQEVDKKDGKEKEVKEGDKSKDIQKQRVNQGDNRKGKNKKDDQQGVQMKKGDSTKKDKDKNKDTTSFDNREIIVSFETSV